MILYYLTEMNLLKIENKILKFIINNNIEKQLQNGIISKISEMMYNKQIDYYYPDYLATTLKVDIKHVNQVYIHGHNNIYKKPLEKLLKECNIYKGELKEAKKLEKEIQQILETKKPIQTKKIIKKPRRQNIWN